jgi:tetratricopeptide (TPR) repeat protein
LRATVEWSYSSLTPVQQRVFDRLAVFVGGFNSEAAEAVVTDGELEPWDVVDALAGLVDKSMLAADPNEEGLTRYRLLETLRAFARERLDADGQIDRWRRRHAAYFDAFAGLADPELFGPDQLRWARRVTTDRDNLNAALDWSLEAPDQLDADRGLRIVIGLAAANPFGVPALYRWIEVLLARSRASAIPERSVVFAIVAGWKGHVEGDYEHAERLARDGLAMAGGRDDARTITLSYYLLGSAAYRQGRTAAALEVLSEGHASLRAIDAPERFHGTLHELASLLLVIQGDIGAAADEADRALAIARRAMNPRAVVTALASVGRSRYATDRAGALAAFEEAIALAPSSAFDGAARSDVFDGAAQLRAEMGDRTTALGYLRAAIAYSHDTGSRVMLSMSVERAVVTLERLGDDRLAALCCGIVTNQTLTPFRTLPQADRASVRVADRMGPEPFEETRAIGSALSVRDVAPVLLADIDTLVDDVAPIDR